MKGRVLIIAAVAVYLGVVACVLLPSAAPVAQSAEAEPSRPSTNMVRTEGMPFIGVAIQVQEPARLQEYLKAIDEIAADGADTVSLVVGSRQENGASNSIFMDMRRAPTTEQLAELIRHAHSRRLRVVLMPIVLLDNPRNTEWRGTIHPDSWDDWWVSYRNMMNQYTPVAQDNGVEVLVVGSELVSAERFNEEWTKTIRMVRRRFKGLVTYSSNWDHYSSIPFWGELDLMGMNSYYKLGDNRDVSVDQIVSRWHEIQKDLLKFQHKIHKPLLLLEAGWCSLANSADEPWDYTKIEIPVDLDLQRKLYEGFYRAWWGVPQMGGFMMWEWPPGESGPEDRGYTPKGKPAEKIMKDWFSKSRWQVKP